MDPPSSSNTIKDEYKECISIKVEPVLDFQLEPPISELDYTKFLTFTKSSIKRKIQLKPDSLHFHENELGIEEIISKKLKLEREKSPPRSEEASEKIQKSVVKKDPVGSKKSTSTNNPTSSHKPSKSDGPAKKVAAGRGRKIDPNSTLAQLLRSYIQRLQDIVDNKEEPPKCDNSDNKLECDNQVNSSPLVKCAICKTQVSSEEFPVHKINHNNVAWVDGDPTFDMLVINKTLSAFLKESPLVCDFCAASKKSLVGFLSHYITCGKRPNHIESLKVKCDFCPRTFLPSSLVKHIKAVHTDKDEERLKKPGKTFRESTNETSLLAESYLLKNFDFLIHSEEVKQIIVNEFFGCTNVKCKFEKCTFSSGRSEELLCHLFACCFKPLKNYTCSLCLTPFERSQEAEEHIKNTHLERKHVVENTFNEKEVGKKGRNLFLEKFHQLRFLNTANGALYKKSLFFPAYNWTLDFYTKNMSSNNSLPQYHVDRSNWKPLHPNLIRKYLPRLRKSMLTSQIYVSSLESTLCPELNTKRYKLFEASVDTLGASTIFCGGPVDAMAWMPTPFSEPFCEQILAVSVNPDPNCNIHHTNGKSERLSREENERLSREESDRLSGGQSEKLKGEIEESRGESEKSGDGSEKSGDGNEKSRGEFDRSTGQTKIPRVKTSSIQFWNFGPLGKNTGIFAPHLEFCIAHDFGTIYHMEWCPSGCYDLSFPFGANKQRRLGLLSVASSDSNVYVYSVPFLDFLSGKFFKSTPAIKLSLDVKVNQDVLAEINYHPTRISWSKAKGHKYLAVGYTNGTVAIFNIVSSPINNENVDQMTVIKPIQVIHAHLCAVSFVSLLHFNEGKRWLITGSTDKYLKYWDLTLDNPISSYKKWIVTDGVWNHNWLGCCLGYDDSTIVLPNATPFAFYRQKDSAQRMAYLMHTNSCVTSVSSSEWGNIYIQGTNMGEVSGAYPSQLFMNTENERHAKLKRFLSGYIKLKKNLPTIKREVQSVTPTYVPPEYVEVKCENLNLESELIKSETFPIEKVRADALKDELNFTDYTDTTYEPRTYQEAEEKFTLVFCDFPLAQTNKEKIYIAPIYQQAKKGLVEETKINMYPIQSVNKVAINPNKDSYLYFAAGYQAGFLKLNSVLLK